MTIHLDATDTDFLNTVIRTGNPTQARLAKERLADLIRLDSIADETDEVTQARNDMIFRNRNAWKADADVISGGRALTKEEEQEKLVKSLYRGDPYSLPRDSYQAKISDADDDEERRKIREKAAKIMGIGGKRGHHGAAEALMPEEEINEAVKARKEMIERHRNAWRQPMPADKRETSMSPNHDNDPDAAREAMVKRNREAWRR